MQVSAAGFANYRNALGVNDMMRSALVEQHAPAGESVPVAQAPREEKGHPADHAAAKPLTLSSLRPVRDGIETRPVAPVPNDEAMSDKITPMLKRIHNALSSHLRALNDHPGLVEKAAHLLKRIVGALEHSTDPRAADLKNLAEDIAEVLGKGKLEQQDLLQLHDLLGKLGEVLSDAMPGEAPEHIKAHARANLYGVGAWKLPKLTE